MTTSRGYGEEERRQAVPQACPHCGTPINEHLGRWDKVRSHCGKPACRKAASRANIAERKRLDRAQARARILLYCEQQLDRDQKNAVMSMTDLLMQYSYEEGHQVAAQVVSVIEAQRCKHDRISVLLDNASAAKRRADGAQQYNRELQAVYQHRIAELESELSVYQLLEGVVHTIAQRQLQQQPDQEERPAPAPAEPEDEDRAAVLATLARIGVKPVEQALAEEQGEGYDEDDDTESDEDDAEGDKEDADEEKQ